MQQADFIQERQPLALPLVVAIWLSVAVLLGSIFALMGLAGLVAALTLVLLLVFAWTAARFPAFVLVAAICCLALIPFDWGWESGGALPKLFADEAPLLAYLAVAPFLYLSTKRAWKPGFGGLYVILALLVGTQALSLCHRIKPDIDSELL